MDYRLADMPSLIRLQPETFSRLVEEARRRHETVDDAADRILREHLPVMRDVSSTLATLDRLAQLRARMKPGKGAVRIVQEGRRERTAPPLFGPTGKSSAVKERRHAV